MGTDLSAVTGFLRLSDNTLATFKEARAYEPSVYYQTGEYRSFYDGDGNLKKIVPVFSITAGATGESAMNPYTSASLAGDNLFLSKNGVFALELTSNLLTDTRVARERSYSVGARLTREEALHDAVGVVFEGRYHLSVGGACYVADSRCKYQPEGSLSYNYEWWYWGNIPARVWAVIGGALWFGTADGRICRFDEGYTDRTFDVTVAGDLSLNAASDKATFVYNRKALLPREDDRFVIHSDGAYARYASVSESGGVFKTSAYEIDEIFEGDTVYTYDLDAEKEINVVGSIPYTVADVDRSACTFCLMKGEEKAQNMKFPLNQGILLLPLSNKELLVTRVDEENATFMLKRASEARALDLEVIPSNPTAELHKSKSITAYWSTPYFDMGTNEAAKTLLKLTLSCLSEGGGLKFGYETAARLYEAETRGTGAFSFEDIDFTHFTFDTGFQNSYSVKVRERNFNYIRFRFTSDTDKGCSLNDLTAIYKINKRNLGVV